jgi:hypothetical protein
MIANPDQAYINAKTPDRDIEGCLERGELMALSLSDPLGAHASEMRQSPGLIQGFPAVAVLEAALVIVSQITSKTFAHARSDRDGKD